MKRIISFFVNQTVFADLLTVFVILVGIVSVFLIRREVFPNVNFDVITITTLFPGASPQEVEKLITNPLEQDLKEVDGIKRLQSGSIEGRSGIVVYLDPDQTTEEKGKSDIQDVVDRFDELPEGAEEPSVTALQSKQNPIIEVAVAGDMPALELRAVAKKLEDEIEKVPGVARVVHRGLRDIEIRVEADQNKLSRYRLSLDDLVAALRRQNVSVPGGTLEISAKRAGEKERILRTTGDFKSLDDVRNTVIRANELGQSVRVRDVATVFYDLERAAVLNHANGLSALNLTVLKKEKADAINVVDDVKRRVSEVQQSLGKPVKISFINDLSEYIRRRISILTGNLGIGLALVLIILSLILPFRVAMLVSLGIPFSFLGTMIIFNNWDYSINLISLLGLIIVSGMLVDDAVVVTDNSVRLMQEGKPPRVAAIEGASQIVSSVTASVLTTIVAFLPMMFMSGVFGKFVKQIPLGVIIALLISLFEAFLILPAHIAQWIRVPALATAAAGTPGGEKPRRARRVDRVLSHTRTFWEARVVPTYLNYLKVALKHRYILAGGLFAFFVGTMVLAGTAMKFILFPPEGVEIFFIRAEAPTGVSLEQMQALTRPLEKAVNNLPKEELQDYLTSIGIQQQDPHDPNTKRGSEYSQITVFLTPEPNRDRTAAQIIEALRKEVGSPPGLSRVTFNRVNPGPPQGKPVSLGVRARSYEDIMPAVRELKELLAKMNGVTDISDSYTLGKEELQITVNPSEAAAANLSVAAVGNTVRAAYEGLVATSVRELDEEIDVRVSLTKSERAQASSLEDILIPNNFGNLIPLSRIARVSKTQGLATYEHEANQRQVKVTAEVDTKVTSAIAVNNEIRSRLPELKKKFPKVDVAFGGEDEDTQESMASLMRAFGVAILGIFLILVMTFRQLLQPMLVLLTIPLGVISVIWTFFAHGMPLSFMGMLGVVALAGVIVNNAIVFVDFVNQKRAAGIDRWDSILQSAQIRIRPIFLTTVTTVAGLLPTAYGLGGLDKFVVPIAMALGWGLAFGSLLTAFVFPAAVAILDDVTALVERKFPKLVGAYHQKDQ